MVVLEIDYKTGTKKVDVDMTKLLVDVLERNEPVNTKMIVKRIKANRPDRAFKMAYAGLAKGDDGKLKMSMFQFALKYGEVVL